MSALTEKGRAGLAECRRILGGEDDPFGAVWSQMPDAERRFWLRVARLPEYSAARQWTAIAGDTRARLKNTLYRVAKRAEHLLGMGGNHAALS